MVNRIETMNIITDLSCYSSLKSSSHDIVLLFKYNKLQCNKQLILGPPTNQAEQAEKFQFYWGEKAELRRFRDGRLLHVVSIQTRWDETYTTNEQFIKLFSSKILGFL